MLANCAQCGKEFKNKPSQPYKHCSISCGMKGKPSNHKGHKASPETREKQRQAKLGIVGEAHWNWRGGKRSERKKAMARDPYIQWRKAVFERDNFTCQSCGVKGAHMHADHIKSWADHPECRYDVANGRALCVPCHHKTDSFPKKLIPKNMREVS